MTSATTPKPKPVTGAPPTALSPHLQIWRFTVTMAASITHRACGVALYLGTLVLALWLYATASVSPALYVEFSALLGSPIGLIVLAGYSWALFFHIINGIRHLFWDRGVGFDLPTARKTAWTAYIGATVLMLIVMIVGLSKAGVL